MTDTNKAASPREELDSEIRAILRAAYPGRASTHDIAAEGILNLVAQANPVKAASPERVISAVMIDKAARELNPSAFDPFSTADIFWLSRWQTEAKVSAAKALCAALECTLESTRLPVQSVEAEPVAWRVKDFADGWVYFEDEERARREAEATGGALQALFR